MEEDGASEPHARPRCVCWCHHFHLIKFHSIPPPPDESHRGPTGAPRGPTGARGRSRRGRSGGTGNQLSRRKTPQAGKRVIASVGRKKEEKKTPDRGRKAAEKRRTSLSTCAFKYSHFCATLQVNLHDPGLARARPNGENSPTKRPAGKKYIKKNSTTMELNEPGG